MIAIIGATGNTGKAAAESLLAAGEKVRVIGRTAEKLQPFVAKGAEPFVGRIWFGPDALSPNATVVSSPRKSDP